MKDSISKGLLFLGAGQAVGFGCSFVMHVATGRILGPERYGEFWVVVGILNLLTFVFLTGIPVAVSKYTAEDETHAASLRRKALVVQSIVGPVLAVALYLLAPLVARMLGKPALASLLRAGALVLPLTAWALVAVHQLNGMREFARQAAAQASLNVAKAIVVTNAVLLGLGSVGAARGLVVAAIAFLLVATVLSSRAGGTQTFPTAKLLRLGLVLSGSYAFVALWGQVDILMLQVLAGRGEIVGLFTAASTLSGASATLFYPLLMTLFPTFSKAAATDSIAEVAQALGKSMSYAFIILCPMTAGSYVVADDLLEVFYGDKFKGAAFALGPLVLSGLFYSLYEIIDTYLRSAGHATRSLWITGTMVAMHVTLNWLLIPRFGLVGVVVSVVVICLVGLIVAGQFTVRTLRLTVPWLQVARIAGLSVLVFVPLIFWQPDRPLLKLIAAVPCVLVYGVALIPLRAIDPDDLQRVKDLVRALVPAKAG